MERLDPLSRLTSSFPSSPSFPYSPSSSFFLEPTHTPIIFFLYIPIYSEKQIYLPGPPLYLSFIHFGDDKHVSPVPHRWTIFPTIQKQIKRECTSPRAFSLSLAYQYPPFCCLTDPGVRVVQQRLEVPVELSGPYGCGDTQAPLAWSCSRRG